MKSFATVLASALLSTACASNPVSVKDAIDAPATSIYVSEFFQSAPDKAHVTLVRDSSFGGQCALGVYLDGKLIAGIKREERLVMHVSPGQHILGAGPNPNGTGVCKMFAESLRREVEVNATLAKPLGYRLAMLQGAISIMPTAFK